MICKLVRVQNCRSIVTHSEVSFHLRQFLKKLVLFSGHLSGVISVLNYPYRLSVTLLYYDLLALFSWVHSQNVNSLRCVKIDKVPLRTSHTLELTFEARPTSILLRVHTVIKFHIEC